MTIKENVVLWNDGRNKLSMVSIPEDQQYRYINDLPCISFGVLYESERFKGYDIFTLFDCLYADVLKKAQEMICNLNGSFFTRDSGADTDGYISFNMDKGKLSVSGQLGASISEHSLRFRFLADQTLLHPLIQSLTSDIVP